MLLVLAIRSHDRGWILVAGVWVGFDGHEPLRPLVDHDVPLAQFATPVTGDGPYQVAVGPTQGHRHDPKNAGRAAR